MFPLRSRQTEILHGQVLLSVPRQFRPFSDGARRGTINEAGLFVASIAWAEFPCAM